MTIDVNALFEAELAGEGLAFAKVSEDEYRLSLDGWTITANLENIRRNAERDQDADAVRRFAVAVLATIRAETPEWSVASKLLFFALERADQELGDSIWFPVSDEVIRLLTLTDEEETKVSWVTPEMCATWGVTAEDAVAAAFTNQARLLEGLEVEVADVSGERLGMIPLASPYKASVIFAPTFKPFVERALGWPVLVVVPSRDFIYVVADDSPLLAKIGSVVVEEFRGSGYPLTTEVLRISDEGLEAIGRFPT